MAIRWRKDGRLVCAATSEPEPGDTYIDDRLHDKLAASMPSSLNVLLADTDHEKNGLWHWSNESLLRAEGWS